MKLQAWWRRLSNQGAKKVGALPAAPAPEAISHRAFLKMVVAAAGGAGLGQLAGGARPAEAVYTPGTPADSVDRNLEVHGNLIVTDNSPTYGPGRVGIGTSTPQGKLDVAGGIYISGEEAIGSNGVIKKCYYAE